MKVSASFKLGGVVYYFLKIIFVLLYPIWILLALIMCNNWNEFKEVAKVPFYDW